MRERTAPLGTPPWYQLDYFTARVEEEIYRALRYEIPGSIVVVRLLGISRQSARALHEFGTSRLRRLDFGGLLGTGDYAICLPHTPKSGAAVLAGRLAEHLGEYSSAIVYVAFPEDGRTFGELMNAAAASWPSDSRSEAQPTSGSI